MEQLDSAGEEALTLVETAKESGYSADHLGRLVRAGDIEGTQRRALEARRVLKAGGLE